MKTRQKVGTYSTQKNVGLLQVSIYLNELYELGTQHCVLNELLRFGVIYETHRSTSRSRSTTKIFKFMSNYSGAGQADRGDGDRGGEEKNITTFAEARAQLRAAAVEDGEVAGDRRVVRGPY